ncbi:MAG: sugar ABC transporter permease, partial [Lachnospiraceae bacterium]|nr:sugar ABC transporter permease [Lachnospiraceae bacterium]
MKKKKKLTLLQKRSLMGYLFVLPWVVGFLVFYVRSLVMTGQFAFSNMTIDALKGGYTLDFVAFENFRYAFTVHPTFKQE